MRSSLVFVPALLCVGFTASCDKDSKEVSKVPGLPENASKYSQKVVPANFANTKNSVSEVKAALGAQTQGISGPGKQLGLDETNSPQEMFARLSDGNMVSRAMRSLMINTQNSPYGDDDFPSTMPPPPQNGDTQNGDLGIDMSDCDGFFADIDTQVQGALKEVQSALQNIKEDEILAIKGVSKGEKAANEAFRYNLSVDEKAGKVYGTFSGGANDTSAFVKAAGSFAFTSENNSRSPNGASQEVGQGAGSIDVAVLVDGKASLQRLGGGIILAGTTNENPFQIRAASFFEVSGGQTPAIVFDLQGEAEGKLAPNAASQKVQADISVAMRQSADKNFSVEFKGSGSMTQPQGQQAQAFSMNFRGEFGVENGKCVVKNISCNAKPATACKGFEGWRKN